MRELETVRWPGYTWPSSEVLEDWRKYTTANPEVAHRQACLVGTRIPASVVLDIYVTSRSLEEILKGYSFSFRGVVEAAIV